VTATLGAVAIYARISQDRDGDGLGVRRQLTDCREEANRRGWTIAEEYVDDDISAYSGRQRPAYRRMLDDIKNQLRDGVIVWHLDRLHRRPIELEEFVQTCTTANVSSVVTLHGDFNLGSGDGLLVARLLSAVAANESDSKRRRGRRKALEVAQAGKPNMGGPRAFGYKDDKVTVEKGEAEVLRSLAERALAGESLPSLCRWLHESDVRTVSGKPWRTPVLRQLLLNPRYSGLRTSHGEVIGQAVWPAILPEGLGERLRAMLTDPTRRTNRAARSYLLSGMCRCSRCGTKMYSMMRYDTRRYLCRSGHDFGGCGRMAINAGPLEELIAGTVLYRLDTTELSTALEGRATSAADNTTLQESIDADVAQLEELTQLYATRTITAVEWIQAKRPIEGRLNESRRRLAHAARASVVSDYIGNGDALRRQWAALNLDRQRAIVRAILDHVVISPARPGIHYVDPGRVTPVWRL
jgi:DNA invertase Pin-like site-specific DNA recombinase